MTYQSTYFADLVADIVLEVLEECTAILVVFIDELFHFFDRDAF